MKAKNMFYSKNKKFSKAEERAYARERLIYNVTEDFLVVMEDLEITQKELARRLGKTSSYVSQILSGRNITIGSLSDMCFAIGITPKISFDSVEAYATKIVDDAFDWLDVTTDDFEGKVGMPSPIQTQPEVRLMFKNKQEHPWIENESECEAA